MTTATKKASKKTTKKTTKKATQASASTSTSAKKTNSAKKTAATKSAAKKTTASTTAVAKTSAAKKTTPSNKSTTVKKATPTAKANTSVKKTATTTTKKAPSSKTGSSQANTNQASTKKTSSKKVSQTPRPKASSKTTRPKASTSQPKTPAASTAQKPTPSKQPVSKPPVSKQAASQPAAKSSAPAAADPDLVPKVTVSPKPKYLGKLERNSFPENSGPDDFKCYGPPATHDGEFQNTRICDMGCFDQDGKDSNKYYHAAVVQHRKSNNWYTYFEWGRTGETKNFQFIGCRTLQEAEGEYAKQLHSKNDKRGEWVTIAGMRTLRAKPGKDCYLVRAMATRSTGLSDARSIKINEGAKPNKKPTPTKKAAPSTQKYDPQTVSLMRDLSLATVAYTRGNMADDSIPTQTAIDEARQILTEAQKEVGQIGDHLQAQVADPELMELTSLLYKRIPRKKHVGAHASTWILSKENILLWQRDLDAFESALYDQDIEDFEFDPFAGMKIDMEFIPRDSELGRFLMGWWPQATANRHGYLGSMKIKNLWRVNRHDDAPKIPSSQQAVLSDGTKIQERPKFQPGERPDLGPAELKRYKETNTALLFHGTRSVNVSGIIREALRLPRTLVGVPITGAMFGPGLYFADDWKKSAGYTSLHSSYWAGGTGVVRGRGAFMFACDVVLGNPFVAPRCNGYTKPPQGHHSIFGKEGKSGVANNEFIIYQAQQNQLKFLAEFAV